MNKLEKFYEDKSIYNYLEKTCCNLQGNTSRYADLTFDASP